MAKFRKYFFRGLAIVAGVLILLMIAVFAYVSINKAKIIKQVTSELSKKIDGNVSIGNVELSFFRNFPKISVLLHDVKVTDTMYAQHKHPFLEASQVFAQLSVTKLIKKQSPLNGLKIQDGTIYIYTDTSGYSNDYLFKKKKDSSQAVSATNEKNELQSIVLKSFRVVIDDKRREKLHDIMIKNMDVDLDDKDAKTFLFSVDADMQVHSLAFNLDRGSFLKEKKFTGNFELRYDKQLKQLQFDSINIRLQGHPFNMTGRFDLSGGTSPQFNFRVHTKDIFYTDAKALLPQHISKSLSIVNLDNPIDVNANIYGPLRGGDPYVYITWAAKETHLQSPFLDFDEARFTGYFTDEVEQGLPRKDPNSKIVINNFTALWHGLPVHASNIEILNLSTPTLTCDLQSQFPLTTLNDLVGTNTLQLTGGEALINMTYKGPIVRNNNTNSFLNGSIVFKDGTVLHVPRNVELQHVNATIAFKNSDVFIENMQTTVLNNKLVMQGEAKNLLTLINTETNNVHIDWNIYSPSLNLTAFTYLLKSRKNAVKTVHKKSVIADMASKIDNILEAGKVRIKLKADELIYKKFDAENLLANVSLVEDSYLLENISMSHAGGSMNLSGSLEPQQHGRLVAKVNMKMNNVDVAKVFRAFENFGQDGISYQNLEGKLTANANASLGLTEGGSIVPSSLAGNVDFSLKNGALNNYEPIKKIQNFIFKKRDFDNIRFAELKDKLDINNGEIKINRMEIQSSVFSMFIEGTYIPNGNTDLSIQVPLNNLKKRDEDYNPENIGTKAKVGKSVYLRGRPGADKNVKFSLDLFHRYGKNKKADEIPEN